MTAPNPTDFDPTGFNPTDFQMIDPPRRAP